MLKVKYLNNLKETKEYAWLSLKNGARYANCLIHEIEDNEVRLTTQWIDDKNFYLIEMVLNIDSIEFVAAVSTKSKKGLNVLKADEKSG